MCSGQWSWVATVWQWRLSLPCSVQHKRTSSRMVRIMSSAAAEMAALSCVSTSYFWHHVTCYAFFRKRKTERMTTLLLWECCSPICTDDQFLPFKCYCVCFCTYYVFASFLLCFNASAFVICAIKNYLLTYLLTYLTLNILTSKSGNCDAYCNLRPLDVAPVVLRLNYDAKYQCLKSCNQCVPDWYIGLHSLMGGHCAV